MAELDFSKIFGETATSKAEFTNENYLRGWGYLGSTPPPYQLFDYLQSQNDKKAKWLYDKVIASDNKFVKKVGDTMTGNLVINNGTEFSAVELDNTTDGKLLLESMAQNSDSVGHIIYRSGSDTQAKLNIPKKTGTLATLADMPAPVDINAHNADTNAHEPITDMINQIVGGDNWQQSPDKSIAEIVPLVGLGGIVAQRLEENGYIKFANGFIIQWGIHQDDSIKAQYDIDIDFIIPFERVPKVFNNFLMRPGYSGWDGGGKSIGAKTVSTTSFHIVSEMANANRIMWCAIG